VLAACGVPRLTPAIETPNPATAVINTLVQSIALPPCPPRSEIMAKRRRTLVGKDQAHNQQLKSFSFPRASAPVAVAPVEPAVPVAVVTVVTVVKVVKVEPVVPVVKPFSKDVRQGMLAHVQRGTRRRSFLNAVWPDYQQLFLDQLWKERRTGSPMDARSMSIKRPWEMLATPSLTA